MLFILSSISGGLEFWSVDLTLIYKNYELKVFENVTFFGKIPSNWTNHSLGTNIKKTLEFFW